MNLIKLKNVSKFYYSKGVIASGFTKLNLEFNMGEFVAITGESGSGKSTLLNVISGLDSYEEGEMYINGKETSHYTEKDFEEYRRKYIGYIFQNFNLVNSYTVYQNIELVLLLNGSKKKDVKEKVLELIKTVDLYRFRNTKVSKLSGGQKQRVAIARALAKDTPIIIADEPTGNLDSRSAEGIIKLLSEIAKNKLVIVVTHNYEQVEKYVTRKIKMHDGKVLEDKQIKQVQDLKDVNLTEYKNITLLNKIRLGLRNTFNIVPKFLLVLAVYFFIVVALVSEYSSFKLDEYNNQINGYNYYFNDLRDSRIVIKKSDNSIISEEDFDTLSKLDGVEEVIKNDLLLDNTYSLSNNDYYLYGIIKDISNIDKVDIGRMPENEDEIVVKGYRDNYYFESYMDDIINGSFVLDDNVANKTTIVGFIYMEEEDNGMYIDTYNSEFYVSQKYLDKLRFKANQEYSTISVKFRDRYYDSTTWNNYFRIVPTNRVAKGQAYISEDEKWSCPNANCYNSLINISIENIYYSDTITVRPTNYYNQDNYNKLLGFSKDDYLYNNGEIYVNTEDYNSLFNKGNYQSSIIVNNVEKLDTINKSIQDLGYTTLTMREIKVNPSVLEALQLIKTTVTIALVIVLFFICYFVIKLILKSRNVYFATIRMLGATEKISRHLLIIELITVSNIAYFLLLLLIYFNYIGVFNVDILDTMLRYLTLGDYILLYVIITTMSLLVSEKFAKSVFKHSAMSSMREEA